MRATFPNRVHPPLHGPSPLFKEVPHDLFTYNEEKNAWLRRVELQALEWDATR